MLDLALGSSVRDYAIKILGGGCNERNKKGWNFRAHWLLRRVFIKFCMNIEEYGDESWNREV